MTRHHKKRSASALSPGDARTLRTQLWAPNKMGNIGSFLSKAATSSSTNCDLIGSKWKHNFENLTKRELSENLKKLQPSTASASVAALSDRLGNHLKKHSNEVLLTRGPNSSKNIGAKRLIFEPRARNQAVAASEAANREVLGAHLKTTSEFISMGADTVLHEKKQKQAVAPSHGHNLRRRRTVAAPPRRSGMVGMCAFRFGGSDAPRCGAAAGNDDCLNVDQQSDALVEESGVELDLGDVSESESSAIAEEEEASDPRREPGSGGDGDDSLFVANENENEAVDEEEARLEIEEDEHVIVFDDVARKLVGLPPTLRGPKLEHVSAKKKEFTKKIGDNHHKFPLDSITREPDDVNVSHLGLEKEVDPTKSCRCTIIHWFPLALLRKEKPSAKCDKVGLGCPRCNKSNTQAHRCVFRNAILSDRTGAIMGRDFVCKDCRAEAEGECVFTNWDPAVIAKPPERISNVFQFTLTPKAAVSVELAEQLLTVCARLECLQDSLRKTTKGQSDDDMHRDEEQNATASRHSAGGFWRAFQSVEQFSERAGWLRWGFCAMSSAPPTAAWKFAFAASAMAKSLQRKLRHEHT
eukprot:jgi/Bigna1/75967/fgenesh1_pg.38_\